MIDIHGNLQALDAEFKAASDRAAAIIGGAFLDEMVAEVLRSFLVADKKSDKSIFEGNGALATFSSKIELAYRLGLLSKIEHKSLHCIRRIRNEFAHKLVEITFKSDLIRSLCSNIEVPIEMVSPRFIPLSQAGELPTLPIIEKAAGDDSRAIFQECVISFLDILGARTALAIRDHRSTPENFNLSHEPLEFVLDFMRSQRKKFEELLEKKEELRVRLISLGGNSEDFLAESDAGTKEITTRIQLVEFVINQCKAAHKDREDKGGG